MRIKNNDKEHDLGIVYIDDVALYGATQEGAKILVIVTDKQIDEAFIFFSFNDQFFRRFGKMCCLRTMIIRLRYVCQSKRLTGADFLP